MARSRTILGLRWRCIKPGHWKCPALPDSIHLWHMMAGTQHAQWEVWVMEGDNHRLMIASNLDMTSAVRDLFTHAVRYLVRGETT